MNKIFNRLRRISKPIICLAGLQLCLYPTNAFSATGVNELELLAKTNWGYMFDSLEIEYGKPKFCRKKLKIKQCFPVFNEFPTQVVGASFDSEYKVVTTFAVLLNKVLSPIGKLQAKAIGSPTKLDSSSTDAPNDDMKFYEVQILNNTDIFAWLLILEYQKQFQTYLNNVVKWALGKVANISGISGLTEEQFKKIQQGVKKYNENMESEESDESEESEESEETEGSEESEESESMSEEETDESSESGEEEESSMFDVDPEKMGEAAGEALLEMIPIPPAFQEIKEAMEIVSQMAEMSEAISKMGSEYAGMATQGNPYYQVYKLVIEELQRYIARPTTIPVCFPMWTSSIDLYQWRTGKVDEISFDSIFSTTIGSVACDFSTLLGATDKVSKNDISGKYDGAMKKWCIGGWDTRFKRIGYNHQADYGRGAFVAAYRAMDWSSTGSTRMDLRGIFGIENLGVDIKDKYQLVKPKEIKDPFRIGTFSSPLDDVYKESKGMDAYIFLQWIPMSKCDPCTAPHRTEPRD